MQLSSEQRKLIDVYGELDRRVQEFAPYRKLHEKLKKQILGWTEGAKADAPVSLEGERYTLQISEREQERVVFNLKKLIARLGRKLYTQLLRAPTFGAIDEHIPAAEQSDFIRREHVGHRNVTAVPKALPAEAQVPVPIAA